MGKIIRRAQSCICGSSDARQIYEDLTSFCFSCKKWFSANGNDSLEEKQQVTMTDNRASLEEISKYPCRGFQSRGITKHVAEFFKTHVGYNDSGQIAEHYYPYGVSEVTGYKIRKLPKDFRFTGEKKGLFGQMLFNGGQRLIITEGELDAMTVAQSAYEKYGKIYPVISIASAADTKELLTQRDWIRGFEEVVLWFDNDEPGQIATEAAARLIGGKILIAKSSEKDASDTYTKASTRGENGSFEQGPGAKAVMDTVFNARRWSPAGIISSADTWEAYKAEKSAEYIPYADCMAEINKKIYGRRRGSITMFTSGTGMGKSSLLKEDQYYLLKNRPPDERIGILSLEESVPEVVLNLMALEANRRIQLPDVEMTDEEERSYWEATSGTDRFMFLDHQGSVGDDSLISKMEFMALSGCAYLYLDHITIAIDSADGDGVNNAIDGLMSNLLKLAKRYNIWIGVVSHLRKMGITQKSFEEGAIPTDDDLKGSGSLKQVPAQIIAISRNKMEVDPVKKNTCWLWILKDRFTGRSGAGGSARYSEETGRLDAILEDSFTAL